VIDACGVCNGPGATLECGCSDIPEGDCDCEGNQLDALGVCDGDCTADEDADGICDNADDCVGALDVCGVCNGQGAIYDCGCAPQPEDDCDCNGNQLDVLGVCGGDCEADVDGDGICDDEDDCVGTLDACGVCNGPGATLECGCSDIPEGDCDCEGNQLDALGVCGGPCAVDADGDGICDDVDDCVGELDACGVCNGPGAIYDCGCSGIPEGDCDCDGSQLDALGECGGDCEADVDGDGICDDVDVCVGNDADCEGCMYENACNYDPTATLEDGSCDFASCLGCMDEGACNYDPEATLGDGSCVFEDACGVCGGPGAIYQCGCANIPEGDCDCNGNQLDALGICGGDCEADENGNGICDTLEGCTNSSACNYDEGALVNDGSCTYPDCAGVCGGNAVVDECGVCNGPGATLACGCSDLPEGDCDCDGNQVDACGVCGGSGHAGCTDPSACNYDAEACADDGSCLSLDCAGVCGGEAQPDVTGACGGDCVSDVNGNGVCDTDEPTGCTYDNACNYDALAVFDDGSCDFESCLGCVDSEACNYDPAATINDGSCVFEDACGVCDGPGAIYQCGCANIPAGDCDCNGNQVDVVGVCGGDCDADVDGDGVCDSEDLCIGGPDSDGDGICDGDDQWPDGLEDECGVWNGPGAIYACGCTPLPEGDCDCNGSQLDAVGECGGSCTDDVDGDGVCDDVDDCIGFVDALGICGGDCMSDCNNNGICDEQEIEGCTYEGAINYNPIALIDDGMCEFACAGDLNGDGWIALADMLIFLTYYNGPCAAE
jgi:hypothetical protein